MVLALPLIGALRHWLCTTTIEGKVVRVIGPQTVAVGAPPVRVRLDEIVVGNGRLAGRARALLNALASAQRVRCRGCRREERGVITGWCELEDGTRLGAALVNAGLARDCPAASGGRYRKMQRSVAEGIPLPDRCRPWMRRGPRPPIR
jgi:endonuclease YncB( thermonuclease family)